MADTKNAPNAPNAPPPPPDLTAPPIQTFASKFNGPPTTRAFLRQKAADKAQTESNKKHKISAGGGAYRKKKGGRRQRGGDPDDPKSDQIVVPQYYTGIHVVSPVNGSTISQAANKTLAQQKSQAQFDSTVVYNKSKNITGGRRRSRRRRRHRKGKDRDQYLKRVIAQRRRYRIAHGDKRFKAVKKSKKKSRKRRRTRRRAPRPHERAARRRWARYTRQRRHKYRKNKRRRTRRKKHKAGGCLPCLAGGRK